MKSDCGKQFKSKFQEFVKEYDFSYVTSSLKYQQSNATEAAVKIVKNMTKKCDNINQVLLVYRSTPLENGYSLAKIMFSKKIRSNLPVLPANVETFKNYKKISDVNWKLKVKKAG